jgi:hypothetical protein
MSETHLPRPDPTKPVQTGELRILDPAKLQFSQHGATLRLTLEDECSYLRVTVAKVFPLSEPAKYWSLLDGANKEIGVIPNPQSLDAGTRELLERELDRRYVMPIVQKVVSVKEKFGVCFWEVETSRGARRFITRNLREQVVHPSPGQLILADVDGNRYLVPDLSRLDRLSRVRLMQYT